MNYTEIQAISSSPQRAERFEASCNYVQVKPLKMVRDVVTRWNSAYKMLDRAVYLHKAIDAFIDSEDMARFKLSKKEWDQAEYLLDVLMPFIKCSTRLEQTTRPGIEKVFWVYENLFNELDRVSTILDRRENRDVAWAQELRPALNALAEKLRKYYKATEGPYVYPNGVIFQPHGKLVLFEQQSWDKEDIQRYSEACRERYISEYESVDDRPIIQSQPSRKRSATAMEDDEYEAMLLNLTTREQMNEYDRYIQSPRVTYDVDVLEWWRQHADQYPYLSRMVRDTLAVPATGAGVERQFSLSGRVATSVRSRLSTMTVSNIMMYKNFLTRQKRELKDWEGARMGMGECVDTELESEVPKEWRDQWWVGRKGLRRLV